MENVMVRGRAGLERPPGALVGYVVMSTLFELVVLVSLLTVHRTAPELVFIGMANAWVLVTALALLFGVGFFWYTARLWAMGAVLRAFTMPTFWTTVIVFTYAALSLYLLTLPTVKTFFGLRCPRCHDTSATRILNFFGTRAGCRTCQTAWRRP